MRLLTIVVLSLLTATCGQKGPLELPEPEARESRGVSASALLLT